MPSTQRPVRCGRDFTGCLAHRLARFKEHRLEIEVALNPAHDIVTDHASVAQIDDRILFGAQHRRANAPVLRDSTVVDPARFVRGSDGDVIVFDLRIFALVGLGFTCRPTSRALSVPLPEITHDLGKR